MARLLTTGRMKLDELPLASRFIEAVESGEFVTTSAQDVAVVRRER